MVMLLYSYDAQTKSSAFPCYDPQASREICPHSNAFLSLLISSFYEYVCQKKISRMQSKLN